MQQSGVKSGWVVALPGKNSGQISGSITARCLDRQLLPAEPHLGAIERLACFFMNRLSMKQYRMTNGLDIHLDACEAFGELYAPLQLLGCCGCVDSTTLELDRNYYKRILGGVCEEKNVITSFS